MKRDIVGVRHSAILVLLMVAMNTDCAFPKDGGSPVNTERFLGLETIPLWPGAAPGAKGSAPADVPSLTVMHPAVDRINGTAVIIAPGGSYVALAANLEGRQVGDWFAARGVTAFILNYRLGKNYPFPVSLTDAQRAIRFVRANAKRWGVSANQVGMVGFSAGGHLTAMAGTSFNGSNENAVDPIDRPSDRPDFIVLGYPAITFLELLPNGSSRYCEYTQIPDCDAKTYGRYVPDKLVRSDTPPAFLFHTTEDEAVSAEDSVRFYRALLAKKVPAELHIFGKGPHGAGLGNGDPQLDQWPALLEGWLRQQRMLEHPSKPIIPAVMDEGPFSLQSSLGRLEGDARAASILKRYVDLGWLSDPSVSPYPAGMMLKMNLSISDERLLALDRELRALGH